MGQFKSVPFSTTRSLRDDAYFKNEPVQGDTHLKNGPVQNFIYFKKSDTSLSYTFQNWISSMWHQFQRWASSRWHKLKNQPVQDDIRLENLQLFSIQNRALFLQNTFMDFFQKTYLRKLTCRFGDFFLKSNSLSKFHPILRF